MIGRVAFAALVLAAVAGAVVWVTADTDEARVWGGLGALLAAAIATRLLGALLSRDGGPGTVVLSDGGFVFPVSQAKFMAGLALGVIVVVALVVNARGGMGWLWVLAVAAAALVVVGFVRRRRLPALRITPTEVGPLLWNEVEAIDLHVVGVRGARHTTVRLQPRDGRELLLNPGVLVAGAEFLAATLNGYLGDPGRRAQIGTEAELARIT